MQSLHYKKYFHGLVPDDPKHRYYYGMSNPSYYHHNQITTDLGDPNDGHILNGDFRVQADGRQNGYYYSQMRGNEYKKNLG